MSGARTPAASIRGRASTSPGRVTMSLGRSNAVGENLASGAAPRRRGWMELKMQPKVYANSRSRGVPAPAPNTQHPQELQPKVRNHKDGPY